MASRTNAGGVLPARHERFTIAKGLAIMSANAASQPATGRQTPITLDEIVEQVFAESGSRQRGKSDRAWGLCSRILGALPVGAGRGETADAQTRAQTHADTGPGPARSAWGLAPTQEVRALMGLSSGQGWVPTLKLAPVFAAENPQATLCVLRGAREEQVEGLRVAADAWASADHMRVVGLRAWVLNDLVRTFPDEQQRLLEAAQATTLSLHRALEVVPQTILAARRTSARVFEGPLVRRVDAALALLASPAIRGAVPEAPALRPRAMRLAKVSTQLAAVAARIEVLHRRRERLQTLTRLGSRMTGRPEMSRLLRWEEERLRGAISELDQKAGMLIYPEAGAPRPPIAESVAAAFGDEGDPAIDGVYALDTSQVDEMSRESDPLETGLIDRLQDLNLRVLTDLASLTERVERGLKLGALGQTSEPSPMPAPTRRSVA